MPVNDAMTNTVASGVHMRRISERLGLLHRSVAPAFVCCVFLLVGYAAWIYGGEARLFVLAGLIFIGVPLLLDLPFILLFELAFFVFRRKRQWTLMDEVVDAGAFLLVRRAGIEERVQLSDIANVRTFRYAKRTYAALQLAGSCSFGNEIVFFPRRASGWNPFARNSIIEELLLRVTRARSTNGTTSGVSIP